MWSATFWKGTAERAIKTFAQALAAYIVTSGVLGVLDVNWVHGASIAGLAAVLSILMSIGSSQVGPSGTPSLVDDRPAE